MFCGYSRDIRGGDNTIGTRLVSHPDEMSGESK